VCLALLAGCVDARKRLPPELTDTSVVAAGPVGLAAPARVPSASGGLGATAPARPPSADHVASYGANRPKSVVELQQFRELTRLPVGSDSGTRAVVTLIDLNPHIGIWYLLRFESGNGPTLTYHLESPGGSRLRLDPAYTTGIVVEGRGSESGERFRCELWPAGSATPLQDARASGLAYAPLCGGRFYLRNTVLGRRTPKEAVVDLLRDQVWQGDQITVLVRDLFFQDAYLATSGLAKGEAKPPPVVSNGPLAPRVSPAALDRLMVPAHLKIAFDGRSAEHMAVGRWYPAEGSPGVFVTTLRPDLVAPEVVENQKARVAALDAVESAALVYLVAFDLHQFDLGFRLGTDHPRVGWSNMVLPAVRDDALKGPDGIETIEPLVRTGMLSPLEQGRVVATFTGGFKRQHGAFRMSDLATTGHGSHYGFVENGVVLSKLRPGLATLVVFDDGRVDLRTWADADEASLSRVRHARQNGVPILEPDLASQRIVAGSRVRNWGPGNWSGSADRKLRTLRAGLCLQEEQGKEFLVYGYFSSATPSAMARVFEASGCRYAMLLDMNALEHTYLAVYRQDGARLLTQHLIEGMEAVDGSKDGQPLPRFVSVADNRDFFFLLRRSPR
jgi:hypothetical protein